MNYIEEMNKKILKKNSEGKYSLFSTDIAKKALESDAMEIYFNIINDWDENCNIPIELGNFLNDSMRSNSDLIAFSRVYIGTLNDEGEIRSEEIADIASNGLKNNGHLNSSGVIQDINSPSDVLSPLQGIEGWINLVGSYKGNNAIILYSLPKEYVDSDCHFKDYRFANNLYNIEDNITYIKPEYLMGMIIKNKDVTDVFMTKEDMLQMNRTR